MAVMLTSAEHRELLEARDERDRLRKLIRETITDLDDIIHTTWRSRLIARVAGHRPPDFVIGGAERPYLRRWFVIPRNRFFNVYLHEFLRSDDDRALHDHPWANASILLRGTYTEHTVAAGGIHHRQVLKAGSVRVRWSGRIAHRVELHEGPCWSLFLTGPRYRSWGFHCPDQGWIHWERFTATDDKGAIGKGCDA